MKITGQNPVYFGDREALRFYVGDRRIAGEPPPKLLLEDGDTLFLENGDELRLEAV